MAEDVEARVRVAEEELNLLKNQVQQTLFSVREQILDLTEVGPGGTRGDRPLPGGAGLMAGPPLGADPMDALPVLELDPGPVDLGEGPAGLEFDDGGGFDLTLPDLELGDDQADAEPALDAPLLATPAPEEEPALADEAFVDEALEDTVDLEEAEAIAEPVADVEAGKTQMTPPPAAPGPDAAITDLVTLVGVVRWVDQAVQRLGQRRVDAILDIWQMTGRISGPTKDMIHRMCALTSEDPDERAPLRDLVAMMIQIEGLLDKEQSSSTRLLAMLFDDPGDPFSSLGPLR